MAEHEVSIEVTCPHCNKTFDEDTTVEIEPPEYGDLD